MKTRRAIVLSGVLAAMLLPLLTGCRLPDIQLTEMITITAGELTLEWDAPQNTVDHYTVYSRVHGSSDWVVLTDVSGESQPEYTIAHSAVGNGEFDFAVATVDSSGQRSAYHTSLDTTAEPQTGWYVSWYVE